MITFENKIFKIDTRSTSYIFKIADCGKLESIHYGSYVKKDENLAKSVTRIEIFDTGVAILAGLMIVPAVYVFMGPDGMSEGAALMFVALPKIFKAMGFVGSIIGPIFFIMVVFAALTSCVSILETIVASIMQRFDMSRKKTSLIMFIVFVLCAVVICLGYNVLYFEYKLPNGTVGQLIDIMDYLSNYLLMPVIAICTCILIGWIKKPQWVIDEMEIGGNNFKRKGLYLHR